MHATVSAAFAEPTVTVDSAVASLRNAVSGRLACEYAAGMPISLLRRALNDAEDLARGTGFPHLFFPLLAEEKVRLVSAFLADERVATATLELCPAA
jgi:hypothetical protein